MAREPSAAAYRFTIHSPDVPGDLTVIEIANRDPESPSLTESVAAVDTMLRALKAQGFWSPHRLLLYQTPAGPWEEITFEAPVHYDASEVVFLPLDRRTRSDGLAVAEVRERLQMYREGQLPVTMPPGASEELGPYAVAQHGEVIAVVGPKQDDFRDNLDFLVHDLKDAGYDLRHLRVIVRDEDTSWAEMVTRNGEFEGLRPLGANVVDVADALERLGDVGHAGYAPQGLREAAPAERRTSGNEWLRFLKEIGAGSVRASGEHEPEPGDDFDR